MSNKSSKFPLPKAKNTYQNLRVIAWELSGYDPDAEIKVYAKSVQSINLARPGGWALEGDLIDKPWKKGGLDKPRTLSGNIRYSSTDISKPIVIGIKYSGATQNNFVSDEEQISVLIMPIAMAGGNRNLQDTTQYTTRSGMKIKISGVYSMPTFIKSRNAVTLRSDVDMMMGMMPDYLTDLINPSSANRPNELFWDAMLIAKADYKMINLKGMLNSARDFGVSEDTLKNSSKAIALAIALDKAKGLSIDLRELPDIIWMNEVDNIETKGDKLMATKTKENDRTAVAYVTQKIDNIEAPQGYKWFVTENKTLPYMLVRDKDGVFMSLAELANEEALSEELTDILEKEAVKMRALAKAYEMITLLGKNRNNGHK